MRRVILLVVLFMLAASGSFFALFLSRGIDDQAAKDEALALQQAVNLESVNGELVNPEFAPEEKDPYWQFSKMGVPSVDLTDLASKNADLKGWVQVGGTSIDYPFVQEKGSEKGFYKDHSFGRGKSKAGWIYLEAGAPADLSARNNILYAGGYSAGGKLFSELAELSENGWLTDRAHFVVKTYATEGAAGQIWEVFSIYKDSSGSLGYKSDDFQEMASRSSYNFGATPNPEERIITIVAPVSEEENTVLHAKLIKQG